jgi:ElaB/YqjD/DUF883 family membrane-anchored ribosome-binding protein
MESTNKLEDVTRSLRDVVSEVEALLGEKGEELSGKSAQARERLEQTLKSAKAKLGDWHENFDDNVEHAMRATQDYVAKNPWQSLTIAGFIGLVIGLLIARR